MFVKDVSGKELREYHGTSKRMVDPIRNSPQEAPTDNSLGMTIKNVEVKRPRLEVPSSASVQILESNHRCSSEGVDEMWTSFFTEIGSSGDGDTTSVWDDNFPSGDLINKHFSREMVHEKVKGKLGDKVKENKAYVGEIAELKNKLSYYEKNMAQLNKSLEEAISEMSRMLEREEDLMDENAKNIVKLRVKEDAHKVTVNKLMAEIEELKCEVLVQFKAGYDKAVKQAVFLASGLKP